MFYEKEVELLCDVFHKCRVKAITVSPIEPASLIMDAELYGFFKEPISVGQSVHQRLGALEPNIVYKVSNEVKLCYLYLALPEPPEQSRILFIGPYLSSPISASELLEIGEAMGVSPKAQKYLEEYYSNLTVISDGDSIFALGDTFCERIWQGQSFFVVDESKSNRNIELLMQGSPRNEGVEDMLVNMKAMEMRYDFENEMMRAVSLGQMHKESLFGSISSERVFESRTSDPIRNTKNYCIIMNTLLRKAAERGGVHPIYLDRISSGFAVKIEQTVSFDAGMELMREMFRSYCRLVRKHSIKKYSPVVQKTVLMIDSDLSADLSLSSLAERQKISPGYLSTVFKKETGKTLSEYIRDKRIKYASYLLSTTHLQIQTVALHCGIMDLQYFSKIFKKHTGRTPKEYRDLARVK